MSIKDELKKLCTNPDFISAYNDFNGTKVASLTEQQLMSAGFLFNLVDIQLSGGGEVNLTDGFHDVDYDSKTYLASGDFLDLTSAAEEKEINNKAMNVNISNVRPEYIEMIRAKKFSRASVTVRIAFMNPNTGEVALTYPVFTGTVDSVNINIEYKDNESTNESQTTINTLWEVLEKKARNHCSDGIHRSYPGNANDTVFSRIGKWNSEAIWKSAK
ncbi:hypothetical protein KGP17_17620 [Serratia sp. JSRIV001]|uniref:hypothetical protein n=1 Tax=Serratia TaxID=613 RepID=UPI001CBB1D4F|nr:MULTISPECIES: hypothetical protein [Serratia]UAN44272.1 hypothetical protein KGP17_17620 [Serratia sp. JSRIV001]CAI0912359.1 Uncharacterised protein [Serratia quinivorans]CAI2096318.1 Uncharacterised protein [Serratia quinivorans]